MRNLLACLAVLGALALGAAPASSLFLPKGVTTATAVAGAATMNSDGGIVTSESLTTAAAATYTLTLGCNEIQNDSVVLADAYWGSTTQGTPVTTNITVSAGKVVIVVTNVHATLAFNGTIRINVLVLN